MRLLPYLLIGVLIIVSATLVLGGLSNWMLNEGKVGPTIASNWLPLAGEIGVVVAVCIWLWAKFTYDQTS